MSCAALRGGHGQFRPRCRRPGCGTGQCYESSIRLRDRSFLFRTRNYFHSFHNKELSEDNLGTGVKVGFPPFQLGSAGIRQKAQRLLFSDEKESNFKHPFQENASKPSPNLLVSFWLNHLFFKIPFGKHLYSFRIKVVRPTSFNCHFFFL